MYPGILGGCVLILKLDIKSFQDQMNKPWEFSIGRKALTVLSHNLHDLLTGQFTNPTLNGIQGGFSQE
jgi:hypothetical protein